MELEISDEWLLRMAERENNGYISVGGLFCRIEDEERDADDVERLYIDVGGEG